jgi:hypothetical protein
MRPAFLGAFLALAGTCVAQGVEMLDATLRKQPQLSYKGERIVEVTVDGKPVRLREFVSRDRDRSRITYPADSPRKGFVIVENARDRWEFNPKRNEVRRMPKRRGGQLMMLRGVSKQIHEGRLNARLEHATIVAGRRTSVLKIVGKEGNLLQRLSIDEAAGMILKAEQFGPKERKLASYWFEKIDYTPTFSASEFEPPRPPGAKIVERPPETPVDWNVRVPTWLPGNFKEVGRGVRRFDNRPVLLLHFSDGTKNFSIFQGRGSHPPRFDRETSRPGFQEFTRLFDGLWFVGLGRVERSTLERVLLSIK